MIQKVTKSLISMMFLLLCSMPCFAASALDELVFTSQKYVVVTAVVLVIFAGIILYLFYLERKIKNLEERQNRIH